MILESHRAVLQKFQVAVFFFVGDFGAILLMAEILHHLRLVVEIPLFIGVSAPSKRWLGMGFQPSTVVGFWLPLKPVQDLILRSRLGLGRVSWKANAKGIDTGG